MAPDQVAGVATVCLLVGAVLGWWLHSLKGG